MKIYNLLFTTCICLSIAFAFQNDAEARGARGHKAKSYSSKHRSASSSTYQYKPSSSYGNSGYGSKHKSLSRSFDGTVKRDSSGHIVRSESAKQDFLKARGYDKVPSGYNVDHKVPLYAGGKDTPSNMQLLTVDQHHEKTKSDFEKYGR